MSYDTNKTWYYQLLGRDLQLYQYVQSANTDTVAGYRIKLPLDYYANQLIYPNEDITDGLRIEYTTLDEPFIAEALEDMQIFGDGTDISFSGNRISGVGTSDGFASGDRIRVVGSASNDGDYTTTSAGSTTLDDSTTTFTTEAAGESITVYQIPKEDSSPDETSHVNLNKMLSLACVDYLKAMLSDMSGDIEKKEYYMREFWKKVGDYDSNRRKIMMSFPIGTYAVR
jgi:hypothetical protein|tara:strand:+ start:1074 stop:1754 length:681 start_codon:yes stop_codon:yes gene_type:complete